MSSLILVSYCIICIVLHLVTSNPLPHDESCSHASQWKKHYLFFPTAVVCWCYGDMLLYHHDDTLLWLDGTYLLTRDIMEWDSVFNNDWFYMEKQ